MRVIAFATAASLLTLAALPAAGAEKIRVITSTTGWLYSMVYIAKEAGFFDEQGLDAAIQEGGGGSNAVASLVGGAAPIGSVGLANMAKAVAKGAGLKAVGTGLRGYPQFLTVHKDLAALAPAESPLATRMALLEGKSIGVEDIGGSSGAFVRALFKAAGMKDGAAKVINLSGNTAELASLKAKRIDAIAQIPPVSDIAIVGGYGANLASARDDLPALGKMEYIVQVVSDETLKNRPEMVERYLRAIDKAERLSREKPQEARAAFFRYMARGMTTMKDLSEEVRVASWKETESTIPDSIVIGGPGVAVNREFFGIPASVADAQLIDNTLARKIAGQR